MEWADGVEELATEESLSSCGSTDGKDHRRWVEIMADEALLVATVEHLYHKRCSGDVIYIANDFNNLHTQTL